MLGELHYNIIKKYIIGESSLEEMPAELYGDYIESLKVFLPQHLFLQNPANSESVEFTGPTFGDKP